MKLLKNIIYYLTILLRFLFWIPLATAWAWIFRQGRLGFGFFETGEGMVVETHRYPFYDPFTPLYRYLRYQTFTRANQSKGKEFLVLVTKGEGEEWERRLLWKNSWYESTNEVGPVEDNLLDS